MSSAAGSVLTKTSLVALVVPEYDSAIRFSVDVLEFELRADESVAGRRWVVVAPPRHEPYGIEAVSEDPVGNRWDLLESRVGA